VSPYITTSVIQELLTGLNPDHVIVLTNWSEVNLLQGSSNLDLYPFIRDEGWELRIHNQLHAKIYSAGLHSAWIGSANLTANGMGLSELPNEEVLTLVDPLTESGQTSIRALISESAEVDDTLHQAYSEWLEAQPEFTLPPFEPFIPPVIHGEMSLESLPLTFSPILLHEILSHPESATQVERDESEYDLHVLGVQFVVDLNQFLGLLRSRYFSNPLIQHLLSQLDHEWTRFGGMRSMMRDACGGQDVVSRNDVTRLTQNLYEWVEELDNTGAYKFGIPRRSQLIRRSDS